ncbi:MAG: cell wall-binding repeat-containing protein [Thermoleophilaceae bacterium]
MNRVLALLVLAALALTGCDLGDKDSTPPQLGASADDDEAAAKLGFPATATRNTIRVGGGDPIADTAGVVSAIFPSTSNESRPPAVALVDADAWQAGIAAAALVADPLGVPTLLSDGGDLPAVTEDVLNRLDPAGSDLSEDAEIIRVGDVTPTPDDRKSGIIRGEDPYELTAAIDRYLSVAQGEPSSDVIVASGERAEYAMPAAAWAARSGDSVLFTRKDRVPGATIEALRRHDRPDIFLLGPESVISDRAERSLGRVGRVRRIEGATAVETAVAFARYRGAGFGWGITVPGYNFSVANTGRPMDAVAAGPLGANGVFAPLLLTDTAERLAPGLENYFLDVQPGYAEGDPGNAVYNRVWILGDEEAVSIAAQSRLDEITELVPVRPREP